MRRARKLCVGTSGRYVLLACTDHSSLCSPHHLLFVIYIDQYTYNQYLNCRLTECHPYSLLNAHSIWRKRTFALMVVISKTLMRMSKVRNPFNESYTLLWLMYFLVLLVILHISFKPFSFVSQKYIPRLLHHLARPYCTTHRRFKPVRRSP